MIMPDEEETLLLQNLGRLREGQALRQRLNKTLLTVLPVNVRPRALALEHGRRLLAVEILKAISTPEESDARDDLASHVHRPREPVAIDARSRRRVPDVSPDDAAANAYEPRPRRSRADRRLAIHTSALGPNEA
jgi:hypothetical protein